MGSHIINKEAVFENLLNKEHYFQSLLQLLYKNELLNRMDIEKIQIQILDILTEKVNYYTRDESSSVRVEVAEQIMLSIYYTLGIFLKGRLTIKDCINLIKEKDLKDLFVQGEELLKSKVEECKKLLQYVQKSRLKVINYAYMDTVEYGIPLFFRQYDIRFASHETPGSIDYPLAIDEMNLVGIEYIEAYLNTINLENRFCSYFDSSEMEALLKSYNKNSHHMLINIYQFVLTNYLGVILIGKRGRSLNISKEERVYLKSMMENLSKVEIQSLFLEASEKAFKELSIKDENFMDYISKTIFKLIPEIKNSIETNALENTFITLNTLHENVLSYEDGKSLDNSIFKSITEEIRDCSKVEEKIKIIREEVHSLKDLVDVFSADCIFDDEFIHIFKVLDDFEVALLLKHLSNNEVMDSDYDIESEREWHEKFNTYLDSLDDVKKEDIRMIAQGIEI